MFRAGSALLLLVLAPAAAFAQPGPPQVINPSHHDVSPPLRDLPPAARHVGDLEAEPVRVIPSRRNPLGPDQVVQQRTSAPAFLAPTLTRNFDGVGQGFHGFVVNSAPPDNNGAVGQNYFVEVVNTELAVFDKATGAVVLGPEPVNTLFRGFGGSCEVDNDGDPTVNYDRIAGRWIVSQFAVSASPFYQCVAVSTGEDPTGTWARYAFPYTDFPDYPKMGVWPDAYYTTYNMFNAAGTAFLGSKVCAFDRAKMLTGGPATQICFSTSTTYGGLLPADFDGSMLPPAGASNPVIALGATSTTLALWKFHVNFATPAMSTFTGPTAITVPSYAEACSGGTCIPQSGGGRLDSLADRLMYRAAYRNFGDHEALVVNHSVNPGTSVGVRWYEIRALSSGAPVLFQAATYAPDATYRWMGSIAMDKNGNIALGYSASSSSIVPEIRFTGRLATDTVNQMTQSEGTIIAGTGAQRSTLTRWGDYTSMSIDPSDDCTFWYTNQYLKTTGTFNWSTRVASFSLPGCNAVATPDFSLSASPSSVTATQGGNGSSTITVTPSGGFTGDVALSIGGLPSAVTAAFSPASTATTSTLTLTVGGTVPAGSYTLTINGSASVGSRTTTVILNVQPAASFSLSASPSAVSVTQGANGTSAITVTPSGGFAGTVSFGVTGLPTGVTAAFNPTSSASASTLTLTVGSAAAGTYPLTVTGTSGSLTSSTGLSLIVTAAPAASITLSATPPSRTFAHGDSTTFAITITRSGFTGAVALSASGVPSKASASFSPASTSGTTSTMTISSLKPVNPGTYTVTITGTGGGTTGKATVQVVIQ